MPPSSTGSVEPLEPHVSDSADQRAVELVAIEALCRDLGVHLCSEWLELAGGACVHVDGFHRGPPPVLAEVFAHQGPLKGGQRHKLMSDAFKLVAVSKELFESKAKVMLVLTDDIAADGLRRGWRGAALKALDVEIVVAPISDEVASRVVAAQVRQRMVNDDPRGEV
jgi:hypothetical protein